MYTINIIGAGKLGQTLGFLFNQSCLVNIGAVYNRCATTAAAAVDFIGAGRACHDLFTLPQADITLIATPDDAITPVCETLSVHGEFNAGDVIVHCSGLLSSTALIALGKKGCWVASVHPLHSFANPALSIKHYRPAYCAVEGDLQALSVLIPLFQAIGSIIIAIDKDKKPSYHAAAVFASNYLITLAHQAQCCLQQAEIAIETASLVVVNLMQQTLTNLAANSDLFASLTGPIKRGDVATIKQHLAALTHSEQHALYLCLGQATQRLCEPHQNENSALNKLLGI